MLGFIDVKGWVTGAIDAFLDIFRTAAEEIIDLGIAALLQIGRPDFTSNWFLSMYASIFGLMLGITIVRSLFVAIKGFGSSDIRTLAKAFTFTLRYYFLAKWLPYLFMVGFSISAILSQELAGMMPVEEETGEPSIIGMGLLAAEIFLLPMLVVQSVMFYIEVLLIQWLLPYGIVMYMLVKTGFTEISLENDSFRRALNLGIVTMSCQSLMVAVMVIGSNIIELVGVQSEGNINTQIFSRWIILTLTMVVPVIAYKVSNKSVTNFAQQKAVQVSGEVRAITQANDVQRTEKHSVTKLASSAMAQGSQNKLDNLGKAVDPATVGKTVALAKGASSVANKASAARAGTAASSAAGPLAVAAVVGTQLAARSVQKRMENSKPNPAKNGGK